MSHRRLLLALLAALTLAAGGWLLHARLQAPPAFADWRAQADHLAMSTRYQRFLDARGVGAVLPLPQLLSAERDAGRCHVAPWILPPESQWPHMVPTLRLLHALRERGLVTNGDSVASAYRDAALNACAGGRRQSRHLHNNALDLKLQGAGRAARLQGLCMFWREQGTAWAFGLGFYANGQIHVDTGGYRSWGQDYTGKSSPCRP